MDWITILGLVAGGCTSVAVIPQLKKAWTTKSVEDISPRMFTVLVIGFILWLTYGIIKGDVAIIATNGVSLCLNGIMVYFMIRFRK